MLGTGLVSDLSEGAASGKDVCPFQDPKMAAYFTALGAVLISVNGTGLRQ